MTPALIWFLIGIALLVSEFAVPGLVVGFFGFGALVTALSTWLGLTTGVAAQVLVFGISSLVSLFLLRRYVKDWFTGSENGGHQLEDEFVGKEVRVLTNIPGGAESGKVELKGAEWSALSDSPVSSGSIVRVTRRSGLKLIVEPLNS